MSTTTFSSELLTAAEREDIRWIACESLAEMHLFILSGDDNGQRSFELVERYLAVARAIGSLGDDLYNDSLPNTRWGLADPEALKLLAEAAAEVEESYSDAIVERQKPDYESAYRLVAEQGFERVRSARRVLERVLASTGENDS